MMKISRCRMIKMLYAGIAENMKEYDYLILCPCCGQFEHEIRPKVIADAMILNLDVIMIKKRTDEKILNGH